MTFPADMERKVRRLDNDVQAIYEMLAGISATQQRHGNRLDELDNRLTDMYGRVTDIDGRMADINGHVTDIDGRMADMNGKLDVILTLLRGDRGDQ